MKFQKPTSFSINEIKLEKIKFGIHKALSNKFLDDLPDQDIDYFVEQLGEEIVINCRSFVLGEHVDTIHVKYPQDWWQAFKDRWFPQWALNRLPIVYYQKSYDVKAIYKDFKPKKRGEDFSLIITNG
jgi:hypothetical protein